MNILNIFLGGDKVGQWDGGVISHACGGLRGVHGVYSKFLILRSAPFSKDSLFLSAHPNPSLLLSPSFQMTAIMSFHETQKWRVIL